MKPVGVPTVDETVAGDSGYFGSSGVETGGSVMEWNAIIL